MISRQTQGNLSPTAPKPAHFAQEKKERALGCSLSPGRELFGNRVHPPSFPPSASIFLLGCDWRHARPFGEQDQGQVLTVVPSCCLLEAHSPGTSRARAVGSL